MRVVDLLVAVLNVRFFGSLCWALLICICFLLCLFEWYLVNIILLYCFFLNQYILPFQKEKKVLLELCAESELTSFPKGVTGLDSFRKEEKAKKKEIITFCRKKMCVSVFDTPI